MAGSCRQRRTGAEAPRGRPAGAEGFYRFELLNPNSRFHLSLRVNYPNAEDVARGAAAGVSPQDLGSDIMVHGGAMSIGCLAVGDPGVEEIFCWFRGWDWTGPNCSSSPTSTCRRKTSAPGCGTCMPAPHPFAGASLDLHREGLTSLHVGAEAGDELGHGLQILEVDDLDGECM